MCSVREPVPALLPLAVDIADFRSSGGRYRRSIVGTTSLRPAARADEPFLREMVYVALFVPEGQPPFAREVLDRPDISHYFRAFGHRAGDIGLIANIPSGEPVGAAWVRQLTGDDPGYGYVDDETPELTIAVVPTHRGRGVGTRLLADLARVVPRCSLSVDECNPARRLYERFQFAVVGARGTSLTMLRNAGSLRPGGIRCAR
jgi:ribosomal protein S18 acetylase RimI-like enzyme